MPDNFKKFNCPNVEAIKSARRITKWNVVIMGIEMSKLFIGVLFDIGITVSGIFVNNRFRRQTVIGCSRQLGQSGARVLDLSLL